MDNMDVFMSYTIMFQGNPLIHTLEILLHYCSSLPWYGLIPRFTTFLKLTQDLLSPSIENPLSPTSSAPTTAPTTTSTTTPTTVPTDAPTTAPAPAPPAPGPGELQDLFF